MKRVFIALPLSEKLKEQVVEWQNRHENFPVRWIKSKNLHITVVPPWYTDNVDQVISAISAPPVIPAYAGIFPITVLFEKICFGPNPYNPRMIWLEGKTPTVLPKLKSELEAILGLDSEKRDFLLHLTIARFDPHDFCKFPVKTLSEKIHWEEKINSITLMESHLLPQGAEYKEIYRTRI